MQQPGQQRRVKISTSWMGGRTQSGFEGMGLVKSLRGRRMGDERAQPDEEESIKKARCVMDETDIADSIHHADHNNAMGKGTDAGCGC